MDTEDPFPLMNIDNNHPITVNELVSELEYALGRKAKIEYLPMLPGDVEKTFADIDRINSYCGYYQHVDLKAGLRNYCDCFLIINNPKK